MKVIESYIDSLFIPAFENHPTSLIETPLSNLSKEARILENGIWHNVIYIYCSGPRGTLGNLWTHEIEKNEMMHFLIALLKNVLFRTEN